MEGAVDPRASVVALFAAARRALDRRDVAISAAARYRYGATAWFFLTKDGGGYRVATPSARRGVEPRSNGG